MPTFRDSEHLRRVFDAFFHNIAQREDVASKLTSAGFVLRFRYTEPAGQVTVDLRRAPLAWEFGETELEPELEMIQSADIAHRFWLGRLNIAQALATRKVVSRGPVQKALKLLPALGPAYPIYEQTLRELGEDAMLPSEEERQPWQELLGRVTQEAQRFVEGLLPGRPTAPDLASIEGHGIPLVKQRSDETIALREPGLAKDKKKLKRQMLERMLLIRAFEQRLSEAYAKGEVPTEAIHLSIGQEGTAVGVCFALRADDQLATTHRGHGHMLAKGADLDGMMAELLGKATGLCKGKGGSMHVTDAAVGAIGANGIVGASAVIAPGAAYAARIAGSDRVAVAFMGDGATNQGMFHEGLNFAAVFDLPVVFVVENNLYGEFTPLEKHTRVTQLADRAAAYGIPGVTVDGNDVWAVYEAAQEAVARARRGDGPTLLECRTYRWHGHMEGEAVAYRSPEELEEWKSRCPIARLRKALVAGKTLSAKTAKTLERKADEAVAAAWEKALADPEPADEELTTDVFAPDLIELWEPGPAPAESSRELTCSQAIYEALAEELERDERVYLLGEDVTTGGYFAVTAGMADTFGRDRVLDTPISEYAIVGSAVGAAMCGARPVAEILFSDFLTTCMDPLVNQAAKARYMSGGQYRLPLVVRTPGGGGAAMAAQHSQSLEAWLTGIPGLIIVAPGTPADAKGLLKAAIRSDNPVLFFENKLAYACTGPVPGGDHLVPLGVADIKRKGQSATVVSVGAALPRALEAAEALQREAAVEVVDVRTLAPLDVRTIVGSVARTGRLVTVEDAPVGHGFGAEIVARVCEIAHGALIAAPIRVAGRHVPMPYNSRLENLALPDTERIVDALRTTLKSGRRGLGLGLGGLFG